MRVSIRFSAPASRWLHTPTSRIPSSYRTNNSSSGNLEDSISSTIFSNLSIAVSKEISAPIGSFFGISKFRTVNGGKKNANNFFVNCVNVVYQLRREVRSECSVYVRIL